MAQDQGDSAGIETVTLVMNEGVPSVSGDSLRLVVPGGLRTGNGRGDPLWLTSGQVARSGGDGTMVSSNPADVGLYWTSAGEFFPRQSWLPQGVADDASGPGSVTTPGISTSAEPQDQVLVATGGADFETVFGSGDNKSNGQGLTVQQAEQGEEVPLNETIIAVVGNPMARSDALPV